MNTRTRSIRFWLTGFVLAVSLQALCGQTPQDLQKRPKLSVTNHGWSAKGDLVLAVQIRAGSEELILGKVASNAPNSTHVAFSMARSTLVDGHTRKELAALPSLPKKPYFGTMSGILALKPQDAMTFGVAFPHPPDPPLTENGLSRDYVFTLTIPGQGSTEFTIPYKKN